MIFAVPGHGKATIAAFSTFLAAHGGDPDNVVEVVCDMSQAFLSGVAENLPDAEVTVDWFHIVQTFTKALDEVRKKERREKGPQRSVLRWLCSGKRVQTRSLGRAVVLRARISQRAAFRVGYSTKGASVAVVL